MGRLGGLSQSSSDVGSAKVSEFPSCFDFVVTCKAKHSTHSQGSTSEESMIISLGLASKIIGCSYGLTPDFSSLPTTQLLTGRRLLHLLPLEVCVTDFNFVRSRNYRSRNYLLSTVNLPSFTISEPCFSGLSFGECSVL